MKKVRSISCVTYPSGLLTLPTIPGSSEDGLDSMGSASVTENSEEHPLSRSWHGTTRDEIDLVLEDYEVIPLDSVSQVGISSVVDDDEEFYNMDLDYMDVNPELGCGNEHRFDY